MSYQISKKRKFVQDGVFKAELDEFLTRELAEDGYSGVEVSLNVENAKTSFATSTNFYPFCVGSWRRQNISDYFCAPRACGYVGLTFGFV